VVGVEVQEEENEENDDRTVREESPGQHAAAAAVKAAVSAAAAAAHGSAHERPGATLVVLSSITHQNISLRDEKEETAGHDGVCNPTVAQLLGSTLAAAEG